MVTIEARFNGPAHSGNGGYVCGLIASQIDQAGPVTSTLRLPPPLDVALSWESDQETVRLLTAGGALVGEASPGSFARDVPPAPTREQAAAGEAAYPGHVGHPFSTCFTCGPDRSEGDGLRVFSGPIESGSSTVAATWSPHSGLLSADGGLATQIVWAAIDCAGGWSADFTLQPMVLGRMTAEILRMPEIGEPCTVVGRLDERSGRKVVTSTALHAGTDLLAHSEQIWIEIDPATF
ncbi:MAG: hypothetical protein WB508_09095 [Aeromicrobium sp.]|uniref:hypothetical protein n=1 Tax=Aeromicrobium sp. TaxID=1871063 RepID=UPI003C594B12